MCMACAVTDRYDAIQILAHRARTSAQRAAEALAAANKQAAAAHAAHAHACGGTAHGAPPDAPVGSSPWTSPSLPCASPTALLATSATTISLPLSVGGTTHSSPHAPPAAHSPRGGFLALDGADPAAPPTPFSVPLHVPLPAAPVALSPPVSPARASPACASPTRASPARAIPTPDGAPTSMCTPPRARAAPLFPSAPAHPRGSGRSEASSHHTQEEVRTREVAARPNVAVSPLRSDVLYDVTVARVSEAALASALADDATSSVMSASPLRGGDDDEDTRGPSKAVATMPSKAKPKVSASPVQTISAAASKAKAKTPTSPAAQTAAAVASKAKAKSPTSSAAAVGGVKASPTERSKALLAAKGPLGLSPPPPRPRGAQVAAVGGEPPSAASAFQPVAPSAAPHGPNLERGLSSSDEDARWLGSLDPASTPSRKVRRQSGIKD